MSSRRKPGPIPRNLSAGMRWETIFITTAPWGYGSLLSPGRPGVICPSGDGLEFLSIPARKKIPVFRISDLAYSPAHPASLQWRDVSRSSRHVRRGCGGRGRAVRRAARRRTAKWCGPGAPKARRQPGDDASHHAGDGGNRQGSPRRSPISRKPSRREGRCDHRLYLW